MTEVHVLDPMLGRRFGGAVVVRKIGEGGMGAVYEAEHPLLGLRYAVKVVLPELAETPSTVERFFQEARTVAALSHPRVVSVIDCGYTDDRRPFQLMVYLDGEDLNSFCRRCGHEARLPVARAAPLFFQILDGLAAAHDRGVIHRDLKGANLHVLPDETIKILDFGIAKLLDPTRRTVRTGSLQIIGTPGYMAPEQARGGPVDPRTDIWALGAVFFRVLTARLPFEGHDPIEVAARAMLTPAPSASDLVPEIPLPLSDVLRTCLAADPDERPDSVRELAHVLMAAIPDGRAIADQVAPDLVKRSGPADRTIRPAPMAPAPAAMRAVPPVGATLSVHTERTQRRRRKRRSAAVLAGLVLATMGVVAGLITARDSDGKRARPTPAAARSVLPAPSVAAPPASKRTVSEPIAATSSAAPDAGPPAEATRDVAPVSLPERRSRRPARVGRLTVQAHPWGNVWIDGKHVGLTPLEIDLPIGPHKVVVVGPDGLNATERVTIRADRPTLVKATWSKPATP